MRRNSKKQWCEKIEQQKVSGKSAAKWCREQNVSYQSFLAWRKRLSSAVVAKNSAFIEMFDDSSESTWMEISTRGVKLVLSREINCKALTRLLETLRTF